jgi:Raf kinase inhibitor-like YbhB/YbcL family protein
MYRKSLSNLLGGSLLVASIAALNACGSDPGTGEDAISAGTGAPSTSSAGTPATGSAGKPASSAGSTAATAGNKAAAGTPSTASGAAGKAGGAGATAAAGSGTSAAAGSGPSAAAGSGGAAAGTTASAGTGAAAGSGAAGSGGGALGGPLKYTGPFTMGMSIAQKHKCASMGDNVSPPLAWMGGPADTKSFAIVLYDTTYDMLHWAIWDIPATVNELPEGLDSGYELTTPMGAHQAAAMGMDPHAYAGPCSGGVIPAGTYEYRLYAMKVDKLGLMESSTAMQAQTAIEGMMLEKAVWSGMPGSM